MMRVLHIIEVLRGGGAETLVCELLPRLAARGIDAAVIAGRTTRLTRGERQRLGVPVFEGGKRGVLDVGYGARLVRLIKSYRPDIVHTHTFHGKYWGRFGAIMAGVPIIVHTEHSPAERTEWYERPFVGWLATRTDASVTFSVRTAALIRKREPVSDLMVIPNGIAITPAPPGEARAAARLILDARGDELVIGVVASLFPKKNHRLAMEGVAVLPREVRACTRLEVFGAGPLESELRCGAAQLGIAERVHFRGFRRDIRDLLPGLDVFLSVALAEAAPMSLLEAMNCGLPIIGTPNIGTCDLVEPEATGIVLADFAPETLARALVRAHRDPDWRRRAGCAGRRRLIEKYDIEHVVDLHVAMYETLVGRRSACCRSEARRGRFVR